MASAVNRRLTKNGVSTTLLQQMGNPAPRSNFRLAVNDGEDDGFFRKRTFAKLGCRRRKLAHYIAAGGTGWSRTPVDDMRATRRRRFSAFLVGMATLWLVFYFWQCV